MSSATAEDDRKVVKVDNKDEERRHSSACPNLDESADSGAQLYKISTTYVRFALLKGSAIFWYLHCFACK